MQSFPARSHDVQSADLCATDRFVTVGSSRFWWPIGVGLAALLLSRPFLRSVFWYPDEGVLLHGADRILRGDRIYLDFFEFLPPGGFLLTAAWFSVTDVSMLSARCLAILTIGGIACFTYLACRLVTRHAPLSAMIAIAWVIMSQGGWTQVSHHWFTTLFSMVTVWATLLRIEYPRQWRQDTLVAGVMAGTAAMMTPTRGALVAAAAALTFMNIRQGLAQSTRFICAVGFVPLVLLAYLVGQASLAAAYDNVIVHTATRYASIQAVPYGQFADELNRPLVWLFPFTMLLAILVYVTEWRTAWRDPILRQCTAFGVAGAIGFVPRMDAAHIAFAAPLICPLFAYCLRTLTRNWRPGYRWLAGALLVVPCRSVFFRFFLTSWIATHGEHVVSPRGTIIIESELSGIQELFHRIEQTPANDGYFFYPFSPLLPFLTARQHVGAYDVMAAGYTTPIQYQETCVTVLRHATWVVIDRNWTNPDYVNRIYPTLQVSDWPELRKFEAALEAAFSMVERHGIFELRRRITSVNEEICAGITR